jgi:hypothetical protein
MVEFILKEHTGNRLGVNGNPCIKFSGTFPEVKRPGLFVGAAVYLRLPSKPAQLCRATILKFDIYMSKAGVYSCDLVSRTVP